MRGRNAAGLLLGALIGLAPTAQAAGSWVAQAPSVRAATVGRETASEALTPPAGTAGRIREVRWRFRTPPGQGGHARLCHPAGCMTLPTERGRSTALAGLPAGEPLRFRFSPTPGQAPVSVEGLQVIVNFQ
ncbi:Flagellar protein FlhE precursor [Halomonas sp. THAF12]|uniref:flagellar protein FlhE n=1 Tax=Halomonas sp. THAF12 TaxID=2587849 RepID=UPI001268F082|nr:flagellar protein FlhE [Halomonas sp. THAF12]QFT83456.1 Flagellar protein FlhE precursor [Halomonas sp. THAF12]